MEMDSVFKILDDITGGGAYLVGGCVRDILLNREYRDIDILVEGKAVETGRQLAEKTGVRVVVLDKEHDIVRVVLDGIYLDITGTGGKSVYEELVRRDFTINAMALSLKTYRGGEFSESDIIDPLQGLMDLGSGIIRACSKRVFEDDPVRALRAFRLKSLLGFTVSPGTVELMKKMKRSLSEVPGERVWEELYRILDMPGSYSIFSLLDRETVLLEQIIPEIKEMRSTEQNFYHADNVWEHCLKTLYYFEEMLENDLLPENLMEKVKEYLDCLIAGERGRFSLVKLACLLHDSGKPETRGEKNNGRITFYGHHGAGGPVAERVGKRLKMSRREISILRSLVEWHMQPLFLFKENSPFSKAVTRFFRSVGEDAPGCLLLSLADVKSSRMSIGQEDLALEYEGYILQVLERYYDEKEKLLNPRPFLNGRDICKIFDIKPSPLVGKLKNKLVDAQVQGEIKNRREAINHLKELFKDEQW